MLLLLLLLLLSSVDGHPVDAVPAEVIVTEEAAEAVVAAVGDHTATRLARVHIGAGKLEKRSNSYFGFRTVYSTTVPWWAPFLATV